MDTDQQKIQKVDETFVKFFAYDSNSNITGFSTYAPPLGFDRNNMVRTFVTYLSKRYHGENDTTVRKIRELLTL